MGRNPRIINYTMTDKDVWKKIFDEDDYKPSNIKSITVKLRETSTADHFRYNYLSTSPAAYKTAAVGVELEIRTKKFYAYIPDDDGEVLEIEVIYK